LIFDSLKCGEKLSEGQRRDVRSGSAINRHLARLAICMGKERGVRVVRKQKRYVDNFSL
jgi:hypothetical protein